MKKILLALLSFFYVRLSYAQQFEPGYLVLSHGDTLRGEVENEFWEEPPTAVRFRKAPDERLQSFPAGQLRSVCLSTGRLLRRELLPIDRYAEVRLQYLTTGVPHKQVPESVLADVLVEGPASLLGIIINETKHFFVRREGQPYLEMAERHYLASQNGQMNVFDGNDYKSQLLVYFGDCESAVKASETVPFTAEGLKKVVQAYNLQCSAKRQAGQEVIPDKLQRARVAVRAGVLAGMRYNSLRFSESNNPENTLGGLNADGRAHLQGGGYVDVVNAGRRLALHSSLLVSSFGNRKPVAFAATPTVSAGSFEWHGTHVYLQFGLRGFIPVGSSYQIMLGGGYELNTFWNQTSVLYFGSGHSDFLYGFNGTPLPYLETGLSRGRFGLLVNGRLYETQNYYQYTSTDPITYTIFPVSLNVLFSYRLNANSDTQQTLAR
ncbi:hypothetical protein [Hymenobacter cavernae]|uniref:PorT family protein n=1 Tax=Hymenobacter cavernae TaxID=2044852 RepID=A0ABQ1TM82_9BACT|nr:hypothetical protein [Hymenobacter cavernae]GGE98316.1 hypothetical protein GCM10011383_06360 [Hymenobacter cavernae]